MRYILWYRTNSCVCSIGRKRPLRTYIYASISTFSSMAKISESAFDFSFSCLNLSFDLFPDDLCLGLYFLFGSLNDFFKLYPWSKSIPIETGLDNIRNIDISSSYPFFDIA